jgi:hypothetical protein
MKKKLPVILVLFVLGGLVVFAVTSFSGKEETVKEVEKPKESKVISIDKLSESERPVVALTSRPDGRELTLTIENIQNIETIEYELVYLTGGVQRGVIGSISVSERDDKVSRDLLLGTCSRGVCRYDENVTGGTLTITFRGEKSYKFVKDFSLEKEKNKTVVVME